MSLITLRIIHRRRGRYAAAYIDGRMPEYRKVAPDRFFHLNSWIRVFAVRPRSRGLDAMMLAVSYSCLTVLLYASHRGETGRAFLRIQTPPVGVMLLKVKRPFRGLAASAEPHNHGKSGIAPVLPYGPGCAPLFWAHRIHSRITSPQPTSNISGALYYHLYILGSLLNATAGEKT